MNFQFAYFTFLLLILVKGIASKVAYENYGTRKSPDYKTYPYNIYKNEGKLNDVSLPEPEPIKVEVENFECPNRCICQQARFQDLPVFRWINYMRKRNFQYIDHKVNTGETFETNSENEDISDSDDSFIIDPFIKQATCILDKDVNEVEVIDSLPIDLQALILLYTGVGSNKTVKTSTLKPLNQLTILEVRGTQDRNLQLLFDEPLNFIQYANFESISLLGSDTFKRPKNPVHPSDSFDYKPRSEIYSNYEKHGLLNLNSTAYMYNGQQKLDFKEPLEDIQILPYDQYIEEIKKARMPSFYAWNHLEVLRIHSCNLKELYWEMFDGLESLQHLSLERNDIAAVPAFALYGATHIKTLSLAHNSIYDLHYRALAGLFELEMLDLSDNSLSKLSELTFPPFPKLEQADFSKNPLRYIYPATFWVMNGTRTLLFDSTKVALELRPNQPFESLSKLQELAIENVSIATLEHNIFKGLSSLQKLQLHGAIHKVDFDAFAGLLELRELTLSHCHINEISMDALLGVRKLQYLDLSYNNLSYIPPGLFDDQMELIEIYLQNNKLQTLPNTFFLQPKLRLVTLVGNPWRCSCNMINWRSKITNQERVPRTESCITDFKTNKKISCRHVNGFKLNKTLTPRCENYNGRSVFYVLRKQLQCGSAKFIYRQRKHRNNKENQQKRPNRRNQKTDNYENRLPLENNMILRKQNKGTKFHMTMKATPNWQSNNTHWHSDSFQEISNEI